MYMYISTCSYTCTVHKHLIHKSIYTYMYTHIPGSLPGSPSLQQVGPYPVQNLQYRHIIQRLLPQL